jgi:recombination protein RecT
MRTDGGDKDQKAQEKKAKDEEDPGKTMKRKIRDMASQFESALPNKIGVERMMRIVMTAILNNPKLALCEPNSFFGALLQALQLGLEVNTPLGQAYLIPRWNKKLYNNKGGYECNFQMGYQGMLDLCYRYEKYRRITARVVYEGDIFEYGDGDNHHINHTPRFKTEKPTFVWALYELNNGGFDFAVWPWEKVIKHAEKFSESYNEEKGEWKFSAWSSNDESRESMAKKTMLTRVLRYAPKSVELTQAMIADEKTVIAHPVHEEGNENFQFDVGFPAMIEAPDEEAKKFMDQVNKGARDTVTEKAAENEAEKVMEPATVKKPVKNSTLFNQDEDEAMEEAYQQRLSSQGGGVEPPNFD